ncbi:MAG: chromate efflux transporter [Acidobacteria bacterium]|nr:chromate efflux transporter [Acidobacteriota bacterium]
MTTVSRTKLWWTFLWLGCIGFGGGIAVLAQIYTLIVQKRGWLKESEYWEAAAFGQSLPGSYAVNAVSYIGLRLQGTVGAIIAVIAFILPSFFIMLALTIAYSQLQARKIVDIAPFFIAMNAAVVGIVLAVSIKLGRNGIKNYTHTIMAIIACVVLLLKMLTVVEVILAAGVIGIFLNSLKHPEDTTESSSNSSNPISKSPNELSKTDKIDKSLTSSTRPEKYSIFIPLLLLLAPLPLLGKLAFLFLRIGAVTFGGGFVMIPLIEQEVVKNMHWLTHQQFVDGMALGQMTPGPVLITATFIGYYVASFPGAIVATIAVFLPSLLITIIVGHPLERFRTNPQVKAFLSAVTPSVVGMMGAAFVNIHQAGVHSFLGILIASISCLILLKWRISPAVVMLGALLLGFLLKSFSPTYLN